MVHNDWLVIIQGLFLILRFWELVPNITFFLCNSQVLNYHEPQGQLYKIPWLFHDFSINYRIPWLLMKFPDFSLTLKNLFFPWLFPDLWQPWHWNASIYFCFHEHLRRAVKLLQLTLTLSAAHATDVLSMWLDKQLWLCPHTMPSVWQSGASAASHLVAPRSQLIRLLSFWLWHMTIYIY